MEFNDEQHDMGQEGAVLIVEREGQPDVDDPAYVLMTVEAAGRVDFDLLGDRLAQFGYGLIPADEAPVEVFEGEAFFWCYHLSADRGGATLDGVPEASLASA